MVAVETAQTVAHGRFHSPEDGALRPATWILGFRSVLTRRAIGWFLVAIAVGAMLAIATLRMAKSMF
jgi:hypothetical protein